MAEKSDGVTQRRQHKTSNSAPRRSGLLFYAKCQLGVDVGYFGVYDKNTPEQNGIFHIKKLHLESIFDRVPL